MKDSVTKDVMKDILESFTRVFQGLAFKSIIIPTIHNRLLSYIIIIFKEFFWVNNLSKQLDTFSPPLQVS